VCWGPLEFRPPPPHAAVPPRSAGPGQDEGRAGSDGKARPTICGVREALGHELVDVVAVLDAGADTPGPRGPEAITDPALAEGCHARGRSVRGIA
jgi:hypothetical protein